MFTESLKNSEERKVDKAGCISFNGQKYEVGLPFIGCTVDVIYDPAYTDELTIEYEGHEQRIEQYMPTVSYRNVAKGGEQNV